MLYLHHANRMETLAARLAERLGEPVDDGWAPETLVVASNGMRRWLCLDLADRLGICANLHFPLPSRLFWDIYRAVLPGVPTESAFATPILAWRVLAEFERLDDDPVWAPLRAYLAGSDDYGRYELARRIADTFDQASRNKSFITVYNIDKNNSVVTQEGIINNASLAIKALTMSDISVDTSGNIYVSDLLLGVYKFRYTGGLV